MVLFMFVTSTLVALAAPVGDAPPVSIGSTPTTPSGNTPIISIGNAPTGATSVPTFTSQQSTPGPVNWSDSTDKTVGVHAFVIHLKYSKADQIRPELAAVIEDNKIQVDLGRNIVIVTGTYTEYQRVKELLDQLDTPPRQVMFEVEIVEINHDDKNNLGIDWGSELDLPGGQLADPTSAFKVQLGIPNHPEYVANVSGKLHYLLEKQKGRLLASPRIATLDGITAHVLIGDKLAVESTQVISGSSVISVQYIDVGIKLEVTPFINEDDIITTHIVPEVSNETTTTVAGNPNIRTRQAETTLRIKSGDTIILGGLIQRQETSDTVKFPLLGDLPVIGKLFSSTNKEVSDTELVILITPKIIKEQ